MKAIFVSRFFFFLEGLFVLINKNNACLARDGLCIAGSCFCVFRHFVFAVRNRQGLAKKKS